MNWNHWIRQTHRWVSIFFTLAVMANIGANVMGVNEVWIGLMALLPLIVLLLTGLYLFLLPYLSRGKAG